MNVRLSTKNGPSCFHPATGRKHPPSFSFFPHTGRHEKWDGKKENDWSMMNKGFFVEENERGSPGERTGPKHKLSRLDQNETGRKEERRGKKFEGRLSTKKARLQLCEDSSLEEIDRGTKQEGTGMKQKRPSEKTKVSLCETKERVVETNCAFFERVRSFDEVRRHTSLFFP